MAANEYDSVAFFQEYAKMKRSRRKNDGPAGDGGRAVTPEDAPRKSGKAIGNRPAIRQGEGFR